MDGFIFGGDTGTSYDQLQRKRALADAMLAQSVGSAPDTFGEGLTAIGRALAGKYIDKKIAPGEDAARQAARDALAAALGGGFMGGRASGKGAPVDMPQTWEEAKPLILSGESGGDMDALYGYANRDGGQFAGTNVSGMTINDALAFADPQGAYGQPVKGDIGRVATPMGGYQIVGSTLAGAKDALGLTGNEQFDPTMQERIAQHIFDTQGPGAWEALKGGGTMSSQGSGNAINPAALISGVLDNPYASDSQRAIAEMLIGRSFEQPAPYAPDWQEIDGKMVDLNSYDPASGQFGTNVQVGDAPVDKDAAEQQRLHAQALTQGLMPGTPEYYEWVNTGGKPRNDSGMTVYGPDGQPIVTTGGAGIKLTEGQGKDVGFIGRMEGAEQGLAEGEAALTSLSDSAKGSVPMIGNYLVSPEYQKARVASAEWLAAILRKDTGAAVTDAEFALYGPLYLPQPGDNPETLAAKKAARGRALEGIRKGLGIAQIALQEQNGGALPTTAPTGTAPPATMPQSAIDAGIDPDLWQYMDPESQALWAN